MDYILIFVGAFVACQCLYCAWVCFGDRQEKKRVDQMIKAMPYSVSSDTAELNRLIVNENMQQYELAMNSLYNVASEIDQRQYAQYKGEVITVDYTCVDCGAKYYSAAGTITAPCEKCNGRVIPDCNLCEPEPCKLKGENDGTVGGRYNQGGWETSSGTNDGSKAAPEIRKHKTNS